MQGYQKEKVDLDIVYNLINEGIHSDNLKSNG
jgi:hypothetical protein